MKTPDAPEVAAGAGGLVALATMVFALFGEDMADPVTLPLGVVLIGVALIILPSGDLLAFVTAWLEYKMPRNGQQTRSRESGEWMPTKDEPADAMDEQGQWTPGPGEAEGDRDEEGETEYD